MSDARLAQAHAPDGEEGKSPPWFVVNTHQHQERIALENLERQHFTTYCPMIRRRVRHARRVTDVLRPLFPGYLFVEVNVNARRWRPILATYGVRTLVRCGERVSYIDAGFIDTLRSREIDGAITRPASPFTVGQQVKLANGAFDGLVATIVEMDEKDRLVVLLNLLNRPVRVKLESQSLAPALTPS